MLRDVQSHCRGSLLTRTQVRLAGVFASAALLLCGCATSSLLTADFPERAADPEASIRSQDQVLSREWLGTEPEGMHHGAETVLRPGHSQLSDSHRVSANESTPGHAFAKPRARLGRPVPVPQMAAMSFGQGEPVDSGSVSTAGKPPLAGNSWSNPSPVSQAPASQTSGIQSVGNMPSPRDMRSADPWSGSQRSGWQSGPGGSPPWSTGAPSSVMTGPQPPTGATSKIPSDSNGSRSAGNEAAAASRVTNQSTARSFEDPQRTALSAGTQGVMSQQSHQTSVVPSDSVGQTAEVSSGGQQSGVDVSNDAASGHDDASEVPTVLDRLRGLYNPRIDENTDRLRKQIRRWPDPFRLFDDRTQEGETVPGESAADSSSASGLTQETAESRSAGMSSDSSESPPESVGAIPALQAAIIEMEKELSEWPRLPSGRPDRVEDWRQRQTDLRLLYMIAGQSAESVRIIDSLPEEEQEFWQSLMLSMNSYREAGEELNRKQQLTESLDHLRMAVRKLQPLSALSIRRTILCDRIDGFGSVSAYPTSSFEPGQRILIYVEPQNFRSELTASGKYRSEFAAVLEFMREGEEEIVESIRIPQMEDLCDVERTDYFQSFELTLPALEGRYLMRIRLRDQLSLQTAEANMEFTVRSSR